MKGLRKKKQARLLMEDLRVCPEQLTLLLGRDICPLEEELRDSQLAASASVWRLYKVGCAAESTSRAAPNHRFSH